MPVGEFASSSAKTRFQQGKKYGSDVLAGLFTGPGAAAFGMLTLFLADWWWLPLVSAAVMVAVATWATWRESRVFGLTTVCSGVVGLLFFMVVLSSAGFSN
jgi:hypothetical protein